MGGPTSAGLIAVAHTDMPWLLQQARLRLELGGMITLDSVRAVQRVADLGLTDSPGALAGYSGGGMASAWAAALAPSCAPELDLAAVVAGGVPADLEQMAERLGFNPHPGFGLAFAAAIGLEREYLHRFPVSAQLNEPGLWLRDWMFNECRRFLLFHVAFRSAGQLAETTTLWTSATAHQVLRENSLRYFRDIPTAPLYLGHGTLDGLTPYGSVAEVAHRCCAAGARLTFVPYEISEHMTTAVVGFPDAYEYVAARLRGEAAPPPAADAPVRRRGRPASASNSTPTGTEQSPHEPRIDLRAREMTSVQPARGRAESLSHFRSREPLLPQVPGGSPGIPRGR
ncbi:hypothetical protein Rruber_05453 (plasmid) [Rhodococcus ruber]